MTEEHRDLWIRTVLVLTHTDLQRRAFIDGYNGMPLPHRASPGMRRDYDLGVAVTKVLNQ